MAGMDDYQAIGTVENTRIGWYDQYISPYLPWETVERFKNYFVAGNQRISFFVWVSVVSAVVLFLPLQNAFLNLKEARQVSTTPARAPFRR